MSRDGERELLLQQEDGPPPDAPSSYIAPFAPPSSGRAPATPWLTTAFFMVAQMAGVGVLGMPAAAAASGWLGVPLLLLTAAVCLLTANLLGAVMLRMPQASPLLMSSSVVFFSLCVFFFSLFFVSFFFFSLFFFFLGLCMPQASLALSPPFLASFFLHFVLSPHRPPGVHPRLSVGGRHGLWQARGRARLHLAVRDADGR